MNRLVGQKLSIVTAKAQTTRHRILSIISEPEYQMILLDTPGIMNVSSEQLTCDAETDFKSQIATLHHTMYIQC